VNYASTDLLVANLVPTVHELRYTTTSSISRVLTVVVDNYTTQTERERVLELGRQHGFDVLPMSENLGFGGGVNAGATRALAQGADQLLLINPDAVIDASSAQRLVAHVAAHPMDLAAPRVFRPDGTLWSSLMDVYLSTGQLRATRFRPLGLEADLVREWVSGACLVASRQLWELSGGFDEEYFMYWEDVDLSLRVARLGGRSVVVADARAVHDESGTQRREGHRSALFYYFNTRNRLLFAVKHLPRNQQRTWVGQSSRNVLRMVRPEKLGLLRPPWRPVRALLRGERDGRRLVRALNRSAR